MAVLWTTRRWCVRARLPRGWFATQIIEHEGTEDIGISNTFKTKKEARAYCDIKNEELVIEGNYRGAR